MAADALIGREIAGYRIEALIGRGGMGVVYRAEHMLLGRRDALKVLAGELAEDAGFRERFLRESRLAAAIEHPNIIQIYHAGAADGLLYIAMRYIEGTDLRELLKREGPMEPMRAVAMIEQVARALDMAHASGLVHRDVKPANILIAREDRVYLSDFGIAKQAATSGLTKTGSFVGTLDYAAPEQIEGKALDGRADVYSLGCVLCECLTGIVPYKKDSEVQVLYAHLLEPPPALTARRPELGAGVDTVIAKALAKSPDDRYATCCELVDALRIALAGGAVAAAPGTLAAPPTKAAPRIAETAPPPRIEAPAAPPPPAPPPAPSPAAPPRQPSFPEEKRTPTHAEPRRRRWIWIAAVAGVLAAGVLAIVVVTRGSPGTTSAAVDRLLALIPTPVRDGCRSRPSLPAGATAGVSCSAPGGNAVSYDLFSSGRALSRHYRSQVGVAGLTSATGTCGDEPFRGERPYTIRSRPGGRVYCGASAGGVVFAGWTDARTLLYARASRSDDNKAALIQWWGNSAGPLVPGAHRIAPRSARVAPGTVIYRDSLSKPAGGWPSRRTAAGELGYVGGGYRIVVRQNVALGSTTAELAEPLAFRNVTAQVIARRVGGPPVYTAGIICRVARVAGQQSYYALQVRSDGLLRIRKSVAGRFRQLSQRSLGHLVSPIRISGGCSGGGAKPVLLSVSANGSKRLVARDRSRVSTGAVGVLAQQFDRPGTAIRFNDFTVRQAK